MTRWSSRTTYQGRAINQGTKQILAAANLMLATETFGGETPPATMLQGGYNKGGVAASAGTHDGGGAFDLTPFNWKNRVRVLRILGCASWHRPHNWDNRGGGEHIHTIVCGDGTASTGAKAQVDDFYANRNGLANRAKDADWRPKTLPILFHLDGDLSTRYATVACGVYSEPNAKGTPVSHAVVGDSFTPVAVVNVDGHYWFVTADGQCGYEDNFSTSEPDTGAATCPVPEPDPVTEPVPAPVPDPTPTPEPDPVPVSNDTTLTVAYWNVGPLVYDLNTSGKNAKEMADIAATKKQIDRVIAKLKVARCSVAVLLELHEENGAHGALGYFKATMPADWTVFEGDGGNHLIDLGSKDDLIQTRNYVSHGRAFTMWNLRRKSTGLAYWVHGLHTTAGMKPSNILDRNGQAKDLVARVGHIARGITCVDKNNYTASPGSPTKRLRDAGIVSMYDAVDVVGANRNSHHDGKGTTSKPKNIDFLGAHSYVTFLRGEQIHTDDVGGDHDMLVATVTIRGTL